MHDMPHNLNELKSALRELAQSDPAFFDELLDSRFLRNPFPPDRAGPRFQVDATARISPHAHVELTDGHTRIVLGARCGVQPYAWLRAWGEGIRMGADCTVNHHCMIQGDIAMGDGVRIGAHTLMIATEHNFARRDVPIFKQGVTLKPIRIGSDVYVGSNVTVLGGVSIGSGVIIAANAVVSRDVPDFSIVGGVPAKLIKERP